MSQRLRSPKSSHATILTPPGETESSSAEEQLDKGYPGQRCVKAPAPEETPPLGHFEHLCNASENLLPKTWTVPIGHSKPRSRVEPLNHQHGVNRKKHCPFAACYPSVSRSGESLKSCGSRKTDYTPGRFGSKG